MAVSRKSIWKLNEIYRPISDRQWFLDAEKAAKQRFPAALKMVGPESFVYPLLNMFEVNRVPIMKAEQAGALKKEIDDLRQASPAELDPDTTKILIKRRGIVLLGLEENECLVNERHMILDALERIFGLAIPYSKHFNVAMGRVLEPSAERDVRHFLTDNYRPESVLLGNIVAKATVNGSQVVAL